MKLAISNIAWEKHDDPKILKKLKSYDVEGIEVAPTKIWANWDGATPHNAEAYRKQMANEGFVIPAMQAILFGRHDLQIFEPECHTFFLEHIKFVADLSAGLGAKVLVLGAPKNRRRGQIAMSQAVEIAREFLCQAGEICSSRGCCIGLEHNPVEYGCDFITNVADARELVDLVNHKGVQLHLDSAGIHMCGGEITEIIKNAGPFVHYHISEPMLEPIQNCDVDHANAFNALKEINYAGWVSIEMKQPPKFAKVERSLAIINKLL